MFLLGLNEFLDKIFFFEIVTLLGGMGVLLMGIHIMADSLEKLATDKLRVMLNSVTNKKLKGVGIGAGTTAIIQSSTATTVMTVSLVNVGILTLSQAVPIIMGANIGTTVTGLIVALQSFSFSDILFLFAIVGAFMVLLTKKESTKTIGMVLAGFGLLFVGLAVMSGSMRSLAELEGVRNALTAISNPFLLLFIGIILTAAMQSSSAVTSLIITMAAGGLIIGGQPNSVLFVILGTNIGTCLTTLIASIGAEANAKRTALVHLLFNVIGSLVFMVFLVIWPTFNAVTFQTWLPKNPGLQIALFHLTFNVITTAMLLPLSGVLVTITTWMVKDKKGESVLKMRYLEERLLVTPSIAVAQVIKEIGQTIRSSEEVLTLAVNCFVNKEFDNLKEISKKEEDIKFFTKNITEFLIKISSKDISYKDEKTISSCYHVINDIDRIADYAQNIRRYSEDVKQNNIHISETAAIEINEMYDKLKAHFVAVIYVFESRRKNRMEEIEKREDEVDDYKRKLVKNHIERMNNGECNANSSSIFINLVGNLERVGDHLTNIARSV